MKRATAASEKAANAAEKAANAADAANTRAEASDKEARRAYVAIVNGPEGSIDPDSGIPKVGIILFPSGLTPAFDVRTSMTWDVRPIPLSKRSTFIDKPYSDEPSTLQSPEQRQESIDVLPSTTQRAQLDTKRFAVVVWGTIEYRSFDVIHHTRFCDVMRNNLKDIRERCPSHNNAD